MNPLKDKGKFSTKYNGPYKIIKKLTPLTYLVRIELRGRETEEPVHIVG